MSQFLRLNRRAFVISRRVHTVREELCCHTTQPVLSLHRRSKCYEEKAADSFHKFTYNETARLEEIVTGSRRNLITDQLNVKKPANDIACKHIHLISSNNLVSSVHAIIIIVLFKFVTSVLFAPIMCLLSHTL